MRLSRVERKRVLSSQPTRTAGISDAVIYLFGSRADDNRRGGDIDLFITTSQHISLREKIDLLTRLERHGIERKVDLIIQKPEQKHETIYNEVLQKGVRLC